MKKKRLGTGKIAFLAREAAIREKIEAGYTVAMLHDEYKNEIEINYGQFLNYVNRYIRRKPEENSAAEPESKAVKKELSTSEYLRTPLDKKEFF